MTIWLAFDNRKPENVIKVHQMALECHYNNYILPY